MASLQQIKYSQPSVDLIYNELKLFPDFKNHENSTTLIDFNDKILIKELNFLFTKDRKIINDISFEIKKGQTIGIIGESGSGKTTAALALTGPLTWEDTQTGPQTATPEVFGDPVLIRRDVPTSYHLAVVVDDATDAITLVTRGMDLAPATHLHRLLQALLQLPVPCWHHHPLILDAHHRKLAKRRHAPGLADMRAAGIHGPAVTRALREGRLNLPFMPAGLSWGTGVMEPT